MSDFETMPKHASIQHLWARHRIRELDDLAAFGDDESIAAEITRLGLKYSLLTRHTSFVAVDTRKRGQGKKAQTVRQPLPMPQGVPNSAVGGQAAHAGVLGVLGSSGVGQGANGRGLFGSGSGYGGLGVRGKTTSMRMASPMIMGSVSRSSIQQVVRKNTKRVRALYERQLKADPNLSGKIVVKIVIGPDGKVQKVEITQDTLKDPVFAAALLKLIKRWQFPKQPGGGQLVVNYPFIFRSAP